MGNPLTPDPTVRRWFATQVTRLSLWYIHELLRRGEVKPEQLPQALSRRADIYRVTALFHGSRDAALGHEDAEWSRLTLTLAGLTTVGVCPGQLDPVGSRPGSMIRSLYLRSAASRPPLRIGLLLDSAVNARFVARILADIVESDFARVEFVIYNGDSQPRHARRAPLLLRLFRLLRDNSARRLLLYELYLRLDARRFAMDEDPLARVDCTSLLSGVDSMEVQPIVKGFTHRFPPHDAETIQEKRLDVLLRFGFNILRGDILYAARYGVWSFHHGDNDYYRGAPPYFWELVEGNPVSGVMLQVLTEQLDAGLVLCKSWFATNGGFSLSRTRYGPYWGSTHFVIRKLHELHQYGWEYVKSRIVPPAPYRGRRTIYKRPSNVEMARWLLPRIAGKLVLRPFRASRVAHWKMAIRVGARPLYERESAAWMRGFSWVKCPKGHYYADPFLIARDGRTWVFFEDFLYSESRGVISCAEVLVGGDIGAPRRCLERPYHLSYPMVFGHAGEVFMIPESVATGTVELYRATRFPYEWTLEKILRRLNAVDTTVWEENGRWWFFTVVSEPRGHSVTLLLFHSTSLTGEWEYHPANPISADVRNARGAGAVFRAQGRVFRPNQDYSKIYGAGFTLNEIVALTPDEYRERPVLSVDTSWSKGLVGTHTYNCSGDTEVVDGCVLVRSSSVT